MQDTNDRHQVYATVNQPKRLGSYLVEAGLLTKDQINVVLNDQQATGLRFGEIVVARGWMKEQTIEWIVEKVVEPERKLQQKQSVPPQVSSAPHGLAHQSMKSVPATETAKPRTPSVAKVAANASSSAKQTFTRRDLPISKPLPSVNSSDNDVNWVG